MTAIINCIDRTGGIDYTRERAQAESALAIAAVMELPASPCREGLAALARVAVERDR